MRKFWLAAAAAAALLCGCGKSADQQAAKLDETVVKDLQAAYNGEMNASAKYAMYAEKAAAAGYASVANLFRATTFAESIHAKHHAAVLKKYGVEAKCEIKLPAYVDVPTSLADALKGEKYEFETMYPGFIADAKAKNAPKDAVDAFDFARKAEIEHARMYQTALDNLESWKKPGQITVYVCEVCGYTIDNEPTVCVLCASPRDKFRKFAD